MTKHTGWPVARDSGNNGSTPKGTRLATGGLIAPTPGAALGVRKGVLVDGLLTPVVSGTGSMAYEVRAFRAVTMTATTNGPVIVASDGTETVTTGAAPGSNSRVDVIWVRQHLVTGDGGSDSDVLLELGVTQGAVSASPSVPSIPTGALALARATVTAGATTTAGLTFERAHDWTVANGGVLPDGLGGGSWFDGTNWVPLATVSDTGWQSITLTSGYEAQAPSTFGPLGVRRIMSQVHLRGVITKTSGSFPSSAETTLATIPAGFRPPYQKDFQATGHTATTDSKIRVYPTGVVSIITGSNVPSYITLGDVRYLVD